MFVHFILHRICYKSDTSIDSVQAKLQLLYDLFVFLKINFS